MTRTSEATRAVSGPLTRAWTCLSTAMSVVTPSASVSTAGYFGNDSFNYHISDGTLSSNSATAFINVAPHVAYIDNTASAVGEDGSLAHPFASIADFNTANTIANHFDIIYVEKGTGTYTTSTGITLQAGQILEGQGVDPSYVRGDNGQTVVLHDFDNSAGNIATIQVTSGAAVTLNSGNTIQGLNITESGSGAGIIDNGSSVGTFTLSGVHITTGAGAGLSLTHGGTVTATTTVGTNSIASSTGTALNITNTTIGSGNVTFHDISANGAVNGIVLNNTGTSGHLAVTGTGTTAGSGGTIQNTIRRFDQPDLDPGRQPRRHERHGLEGLRHHRPYRERHRAQPRQRFGQRQLHRE